MESGNDKNAFGRMRQRSESIMISLQDRDAQISNQQDLSCLHSQLSEGVIMKNLEYSDQLQKQKRKNMYMSFIIAVLLLFCIFIVSGGLSLFKIDKENGIQQTIQQEEVSAQEGQTIIENPTDQQSNAESGEKSTKQQQQPLDSNVINTAAQDTQQTEQKIQQEPAKEPQNPVSQQQLLQYVSEQRVQTGGKTSAKYETTWTVDLSYVKQDGKGLAEVLYPDPKVRRQRETFHKQRIEFVNQNSNKYQGINMIKYNMRINGDLDEMRKKQEQEDYLRLEKQFHYSQVKEELPMCLVVRTWNNNQNSRIEYNLNSIFTQNYSNYMAIIANDASTDGTDLIIRKYFHFFQIPQEKYVYVQHKARHTALQNTYTAVINICSNDSIVLVLDGDDEIIGRNTFKTFNREHQRLKGGWIYTNNFHYIQKKSIKLGSSKEYSIQQKKQRSFRSIRPQLNFHFRSFLARLFKLVPSQYFKDNNGQFYKYTEDVAIHLPVMELACGHVYFVDTFTYLYNQDTGQNDWILHSQGQVNADVSIRRKPKLDCLPQFKERPFMT